MSSHNICFSGDIRKNIYLISFLCRAMHVREKLPSIKSIVVFHCRYKPPSFPSPILNFGEIRESNPECLLPNLP